MPHSLPRAGGSERPAFLAIGCVGLAFASPALAAEPAPDVGDGSSPESREERDRLNAIIVTGQRPVTEDYGTDHASSIKFTAPLLDTPRSVTVIPHELIRDSASTTLAEALRTVPGITLGAGEGGNPLGDRPFIRGYDSQASTYLDGVRDIAAQTRETFDLDSIEVIKGSDGAFGGRGSPGGSINLVSKLPLAGTSVSADAAYGSADYKRATGDANLQLSPTVAARLAAMVHDQGVAGRDAVSSRRWGVAPAVTIGLGTPTRLTFAYYHLASNDLPDSGIPYLYTTANLPAGVTRTAPIKSYTTIAGERIDRPRSTFYGLADRDFRHTRVDEATIRTEHDFGGRLLLRNTARYAHTIQNYIYTQPDDSQGNVYGTNATGTNAGQRGGYVWRRANTRFGTTDGLLNQTDLTGAFDTFGLAHSFAVGSEFSWEDTAYGAYTLASGSTITPRCTTAAIARRYCTTAAAPDPGDPFVNYASDTSPTVAPIMAGASRTETLATTRTLAGYAFDTITVTRWLLLNGGIRYDDYKTRVRQPVVAAARPTFARHDGIWTGQASAIVKPTPDTSVYLTYATAAVPPGTFLGQGSDTNAAVPGRGEVLLAPDDLKVETTKSYEIGAKAGLFNGRLSLTAAAFELKTQNARATGDDGTVQYIGSRRIRGFELGWSGAVTPAWKIFGGYTYMDARITDGGFTATTGIVAGRPVTLLAPSVNTGKRFPNTPRDSFTTFTSVQATPRLSIGGGAIFMGRVNGGYGDLRSVGSSGQLVIANALTRYVPGYWRFDANAAFSLTPHVSLRLNALNLTDKLYYDQAYAAHYASQAAGRTVIGTLAVRY